MPRHVDRRRLGDFLDFFVLNAGSAHADALGSACHHGMNLLQVDFPATRRHIMGVAHTVAELRAAAANITHLRHSNTLLVLFRFV